MKADTRRFSRETLCFLLASFGLALALYQCLSSAPLRLDTREPVSAEPQPLAACGLEPPVAPEKALLAGGRRSPFRPVAVPRLPPEPKRVAQRADGKEDPKETRDAGGDPVIPVAPPATRDVSELQFTGVVLVGGQARGLLQAREGAELISVKPGDRLPDFGCTVTKIDKQAIHLTDAAHREIVLTDGR